MTDPSSASRGAVHALEAVRPAVERLSPSRSSEDNASDLTAICAGVELALGALLGRTDLSGQALVREARQRESISLEQAHAALEMFAVRDRVSGSSQVDAADLDVARQAYEALAHGFRPAAAEPAVVPGAPSEPPVAVPSGIPLGIPPAESIGAPPDTSIDPVRGAAPHHGPLIVAAVIAVLVLLGVYYLVGRGEPAALKAGKAAFAAGQRDSAVASFARAARDEPRSPLPHLYLARIARENGDYATAGKELNAAIQLDPAGAAGQRELGAFFLARGASFAAQRRPDLATQDYEAARRAYVRVIQANPADSASQGYLACALARLGRADEAATWLKRAGPGPWATCAASLGTQ